MSELQTQMQDLFGPCHSSDDYIQAVWKLEPVLDQAQVDLQTMYSLLVRLGIAEGRPALDQIGVRYNLLK